MTETSETRPFKDPRQGNFIVRLFRGFGYMFEGWGFVFGKHPSLLKLCVAPLLINLLVFAGVSVGLYFYYGELVNLIWARPDSWFSRVFWYLFYVFIFLAVMLVSYVVFFVVQAILSAPFNDMLSERVEMLAYGKTPPPFSWGFLARGLGRTLLHELAKLGIYVMVILPMFLLSLVIPVIGPVMFLFLGFYLTATFFAYDYMDYCMARAEWPFKRKWALLKQNRALTLGFGSSLTTALLIPVVGLVCVPMAAVGGTLLYCDLQRAEEQASPESESEGEDLPAPADGAEGTLDVPDDPA